MSQAIEVKVPDIGDYKDIPVIEVLVKAGDTVEKEQSLVTLESDKATMDVPSTAAGTVKEVKVKVGDNVSEGSLIVVLDGAGGGAAAAPAAAAPAPASAPAPAAAPAAAPAPAAGGGVQEVKVPDIGDYKDVPVIEIGVKVGDRVEKEQSLVTLESDKATMDVPSPAAGVVKEIKVKVGDTVSEGSVIVLLESEGAAAAPAAASAPKQAVEKPSDAPAPAAAPSQVAPSALAQAPLIPAGEGGARHPSHASPSVRKFARELGVDVAQVQGT
ncbi:MAG: E3 binding domain-containing protein, partial [Paraburkholderia sp.]|nr:E3 binding domain-containing protein [Paraburkholderia sp.]